MLVYTLHSLTADGVKTVIWLFSSHTGTICLSSSLVGADRDKGEDSIPLWLLLLSGIVISTAIVSCSSIMEVSFTKENVAVADNVAQTEISVFLQNS